MPEIKYDDSRLKALIEALDERQRIKAFRGALRRLAGKVRKAAAANLRASKLGNAEKMDKAIRATVWKRRAGFKVTVAPKRGGRTIRQGFHTNRRREIKPIPLWAAAGTNARKTKSKTRFWTRSRKGHSTGRMKRYGFMTKTKSQVEGSVTSELKESIVKSVKRIAKKYGCV